MNKNSVLSNAPSFTRPDFLSSASGPVAIRMSNDYLFRSLLQTDENALRGLVCALLHLKPEQITSISISNPIELGAAIDDKFFILDIKILLNRDTIINLELQVINTGNWPERSLSYLCRSFDNLNPGENYMSVRTAIHISLLDFSPFPKLPEFYATYKMLNVKNHSVYSDKLRLSVVDLTRIDLATEEDRFYHIDKWASLFKATTWEEIKMITQSDENIRNAANTVWKLSQEEEIRLQCEAREDFYRTQRDMEYVMSSQAETIAAQQAQLEEQRSQLQKQKNLAAITSIKQILNYARKGRPSEECADMLGADPSFVDLVYAQFHKDHGANASKIFDFLKAGGKI